MRGFLRRVSYVSAANAINGVLGIVFVPVAVHRLGTAGYGLFSIYAVLAGYVILVELGLGKNLVRVLAGARDDEDRLRQLRLAWGLYLSVCGVLVVLAPLAAWAVPRFLFPVDPDQRWTVAAITLLAIADYLTGVPVSLRQNRTIADERFDQYARFLMGSGLLRYVLSFAAVLAFTNPAYVVAAVVTRRLGDLGLARWLMGPLPPGAWRPLFDRGAHARMIGHSSALSLAQLLQITVVSVGAMLVNYLFGLRSLGVYRAVFDLTSKVWFFSNFVGFVVFPGFVRLLRDPAGRARLAGLLPSVLQASWLAFCLLALGGGLVGPLVLPRIGLGGELYAALFVTLMVGVSLNAHTNLAYEFLQANGRYAVVALLAALSLGTLLACFFALAPTAGVLAIGWAWLISQILYALACDVTVLRVLHAVAAVGRRHVLARGAALGAVLSFAGVALGAAPRLWWVGVPLAVAAAALTLPDAGIVRDQPWRRT